MSTAQIKFEDVDGGVAVAIEFGDKPDMETPSHRTVMAVMKYLDDVAAQQKSTLPEIMTTPAVELQG